MQKGQIIKGVTVEEKIDSIERVLKSHRAKLSTKVIGVIPPIPIFENMEVVGEDGIITQKLFPLPGVITKTCLMVREYTDNKGVKFAITSMGIRGGNTTSFETRKHLLIENIDLSVSIGDLVTLKVESPERVKGIFLGILFEVSIEGLKKEDFLLDNLLKMNREEDLDAKYI